MADPPFPTPAPAPPSGPLVYRGGGVVGVQTDAMTVGAVALAVLEEQLRSVAHRAGAVPSVAAATAGGPLVAIPLEGVAGTDRLHDAAVDAAGEELGRTALITAERTAALRDALRRSAAAYAAAEDAARSAVETAAQAGARIAGQAWTATLSILFGAAAGAFLAWALSPGTDAEKSAALAIWMREHPRLITNPGFVAVVRAIAGSVDDALAGAGLATAADRGREVPGSGVELGADGVLIAGGALGLLRESGVKVRRVRTDIGTVPPTGIADRLRRVPEGDQVRIEKYAAPGQPTRWIVYVDPTETFTATATREPWDLASNIDGTAGRSSASYRATESAMRQAGIAPDDPVAFVGFSQGGLVAGMLAGSGRWNAQGLDTFAAPIGNVPLPDDLPGMQVRHTDDFVPALAGPDLPTERLLVEQRAFADEILTSEPAPAHQRDSYDRTAADIDASESPQVRAQLDAMRRFAADQAARPGAVSETFLYHADRVGQWRDAVDQPLVPRPYASRAR